MFNPLKLECVWKLRSTGRSLFNIYSKINSNPKLNVGYVNTKNMSLVKNLASWTVYKQCNIPVTNYVYTLTNFRVFSTKPKPDVKNQEPPITKESEEAEEPEVQEEKLSLFQRYKKMAKEYWYVLIPVHIVTSTAWFGAFFYASKCGFDIVPYLEYFGVSETVIRPFRNSSLGHVAVAWALYKVATPARYTVTLAGTTMTIRFFTKRGLIKPMPSKENIKAIYHQKKDEFIQRKMQKQ